MQRIQWTEGRGAHFGRLGRWELFTISRSTRPDDPLPWRLDSSFPILILRSGFDSVESAKERAEKVMTEFLDDIGARWKSDE